MYEGLNDLANAVKYYKDVLQYDNTNVEAIACLATNHFYTDQPEIALKYYRRLLQMGVYNAELYNNLGLCCYYAQQYDMSLTCFERALSLANDETMADIWFNIGHIGLGIGDRSLAYQCFQLAVAANNDHSEAYNNLGVLELNKGHNDQARGFLLSSLNGASHLFEPHYNYAALSEKLGDLQNAYSSVKKALEIYPDHSDSKLLLKKIQRDFSTL